MQSGTGPLGLFQLTRADAEKFGLKVFKDASPSNPDERCDVKLASMASAKYIKHLMVQSTSESNKLIYAILSYSWTGTLQISEDLSTIISENEKLMKKYRVENFRYIPMFFAAAIVGENPKDFGLKINPLSSYIS